MERDINHGERATWLVWPPPMSAALALAMLLCSCGGGSSSGGAPATYSIGGTITGLTAAGLVLANGSDTVSPSAGALSFTFAIASASGSTYAVAVKTQPKYELCQVANGSGQVASAAVTSVTVTCAHAWIWVGGSNTVNATGGYGTLGIAAATSVPGARDSPVTWIDSAGDLWLFGGTGYNSAGGYYYSLNDLWRYAPSTGLWTWISGSNTVNAKGVYGTQGVAAAGNVPGARTGSVSWSDSAGALWLFGGAGYDSAGAADTLNDLWRYSPGTGLWTWIRGSNTVDSPGVYGTQGVAAAGNTPGARTGSVSWSDSAANLWLLGGYGVDSTAATGYLGDLWRYSTSTGLWTWVSGSSTVNAAAVYGTQGVAAAANVPGARIGSVAWTDRAGDLWMFGGGSASGSGPFNDLWRYSPGTGLWTWISGSNTADATGVYGTQGVAAAGNVPGARSSSASWTDSAGDLWLFGGGGLENDLWRYSPATGLWTWVSGTNGTNARGLYGTLGVAAASNEPGSRYSPASWSDSAGNLWLFGGYGFDSVGACCELNDLWVY